MQRQQFRTSFPIMFLLLLTSCTFTASTRDIVDDSFPEAQAELRDAVDRIAHDAMTSNIAGLQDIHLDSPKFSKFGPRSFERQDVASTNKSEAAFFGSVTDMNYEVEDLKIDVFGDVAVVTYYPHVTFVNDGENREVRGRQTFVFVKTGGQWKLAHEHGTVRR